jgi:spermidine synthase
MGATTETHLFRQDQRLGNPYRKALRAGVGLSSFAALLLELVLTRIFSVVLFYHFAFLAISIALLGLGAGGVFAYLKKSWLLGFETRSLVSVLALCNTVAVPVLLEIVLHVPVSLQFSTANLLRLTVLYLSSGVPFFFTGLGLSVIFARQPLEIPGLYGADLLGAGMACLAVIPLLNGLGGPNAMLFAGLVSGLAGAVWAATSKLRRLSLGFSAALACLVVANHSGRLIDVVYAKGVFRDKAWVEFARWNAISRVEVDRQAGAKAVVIDADASTYIMNADLAKWPGSVWERNLMSAPAALANVLRPRGDFAIIGPGGGVDVLRAVASGSPSVTGIEINPIIGTTIMRDRYADYSYHLYQLPQVHIYISDGRSFVRNAHHSFDVVQMTLVDTWASTAAGAFALSENSLYTVEAFREYFEHLKPDGMVAVTRWEFRQPREALRVVSVAMAALHQLGVPDTRRNFIVVSEGSLNDGGIPVVVLAKKTAFTAEEQQAVRVHLLSHGALQALYIPGETAENPFGSLLRSNDPSQFAEHYPYNVSPVYDNAPFFFFTVKLGQILNRGSFSQGIDWKVNLGVAVLGMILIISFLAVLVFLMLPMLVGNRPGATGASNVLYFVAVGFGYILVEIAFVQRFVLFLGQPAYALTVVVFLLLLSSGAGSVASRAWIGRSRSLRPPLLWIVGLLLVYVFALPRLLNALVGLPFAAKLLVSTALLVPLGFPMGMPFPGGLRAIARGRTSPPLSPAIGEESDLPGPNAIEWAWAMNAGASVLGSVLAMVIAIQFGLNATLASGAGAYCLAFFLTARF